VATRTRVACIAGRGRVQAVELEHLDTGARRLVRCDTVIFTGDWIPDNELARARGLQIDPDTLGPLIDTRQATTASGVFATGNLVHPVDTADITALDGRAVAATVLDFLRSGAMDAPPGLRVLPGANLKWISPGIFNPTVAWPRRRLSCWPRHHLARPTVTVSQGNVTLERRRLAWPASPGRIYRLPASLLAAVDPTGPEVTVGLVATQRR
jgi:hypothetical protein